MVYDPANRVRRVYYKVSRLLTEVVERTKDKWPLLAAVARNLLSVSSSEVNVERLSRDTLSPSIPVPHSH